MDSNGSLIWILALATLVALASSNPATDEGFAGPDQMTFDGRALAIVRPDGIGKITVTISGDDLEAAVLELFAGVENSEETPVGELFVHDAPKSVRRKSRNLNSKHTSEASPGRPRLAPPS